MSLLWFNGGFIDAATIAIDPADRGLLLGDGAFETIAVFNGLAFHAADHVARMMTAVDALGLGLARARIEEAATALLARSKNRHGILRLTTTRGPAPRGLAAEGRPNLLASLAPWSSFPWMQPLELITATIRRNERSPASRLKTLSYIDNILAARQAAAAGADDALMLNSTGRIACSTIANLFVVKHGRLITPPSSEGALPGITRKLVMENLGAVERPITTGELAEADEVFATNSIRLVRPVASIDGRTTVAKDFPTARACFDRLVEAIAAECGAFPPNG